jgi:hypothetical protein
MPKTVDYCTGVDRALDQFQPMHRWNLVACTVISAVLGGISIFSGAWVMSVIVCCLAWFLRCVTDQLMLHWCLYRQYSSLSNEQRRLLYRRSVGYA